MSDSNKILLLSTIADILLFGIAILDSFNRKYNSGLPDGYFTFLRIVTCATLVWYCVLLRSPYWRFLLAAGAILYNPIIPIHLDDRGPWCFFNVVTVAALLIAYFRYRKQLTKDAPNEN